jgi:2-(3-amino-3-carboxypropyl)histidine synthase
MVQLENGMYDLELEKLRNLLVQKNYSRVSVQVPDGLLGEPLATILETIRAVSKNIEIFVLGDPCFGACDIGIQPALAARCQALFHFGHSQFSSNFNIGGNHSLDVYYFDAKVNIPIQPALEIAIQEARQRNFTSIGLAATIQHLHDLPVVEELLRAAGFEVHVGEPTKRLRRGQILGCDIGSLGRLLPQKIHGTIFIGGGRFHALILLRKTRKPVLATDPYLRKVEVLEENDLQQFYRKRYAAVNKIQNASKVGILVSTKTGQYNRKLVQQARAWLEKHQKTWWIVLVSTASPQHLSNFHVDGWISTMCPRVALDDSEQYDKPIINLDELDWDSYVD